MKRLIISPHVDDDVLGCGGILDETCVVFYCAVDPVHVVTAQERLIEAEAVARDAGHYFYWPELFGDGAPPLANVPVVGGERPNGATFVRYQSPVAHMVNNLMVRPLITLLEQVIDIERPDEIYIPERASYNQDHVAVFDAAMVATRPHDKNWFVPRVLAYEQPHVIIWPREALPQPNYYRQIKISTKLRRYHLMKSQVRAHRSEGAISSLSELRGAAAGLGFAEAFRVLRWVDA